MMKETHGQRLRRLRKAHGLTQKELGKRAGIGQTAIANIEADARGFGLSLLAIAKELSTTPEYLSTGQDRPSAFWPFKSFTSEQYHRLDQSLRDEVEDRLLGAIMRQEKMTGTHN